MRKITTLFALLLMAVIGASAANVAKIGTTKYATLQEAINSVAENGTATIEILGDIANGSGFEIPDSKANKNMNITIDFKNYTYNVSNGLVGSTNTKNQAMHFAKGNTLTLKNGTITVSENLALIMMQNYCNLTLDNMNIDCSNVMAAYYNDPIYEAYPEWYKKRRPVFNYNAGSNGSTITNNSVVTFANGDEFGVIVDDGVNITIEELSVINGNVSVLKGTATLDEATVHGTITVTPNEGSVTVTNQPQAVAKIGDDNYPSLETAWKAAKDGQTITLLANCSGNGLKAPQGKFNTNGLTVDFNGFTYTVDGSLVGSTGTETQAFQLLKNNTITFMNGTIYSEKAKMLVQNYSNLTLKNMTLTLDNPNYYPSYTLSNNNGDTTIDGSTINVNPAGGFAFDVCRFSNYPSVNVTVTGNSTINGDVEVYASNGDAKNGFSLTLESGTLNGNIVLDETAKTPLETSENAYVKKENTFDQEAPFGYEWVADTNGSTSHLAEMMIIQDGVAYDESMKSDEQINFVYSRTFTEDMVGKYQCWCAPFTVTPDQSGKINGEIPGDVEFYKIDGPATGIEAGNTIAISKITSSVDANWPVVIKVSKAGTYNFLMYGYIGANTSPIQIENDNYNITITGTYDFTTANALNEWASLNTDGQLIWSYKGDTVKPYRWILKATDKNGNSAPIHNLKFVEVDNAGIDTGISTINAVSSDSEVEAIYSANGQRLQSMQKGINIIRMKDNTVKKVIIK